MNKILPSHANPGPAPSTEQLATEQPATEQPADERGLHILENLEKLIAKVRTLKNIPPEERRMMQAVLSLVNNQPSTADAVVIPKRAPRIKPTREDVEQRLNDVCEGRMVTVEQLMDALEQIPGVRRHESSYQYAQNVRDEILGTPDKVKKIIEAAQQTRRYTLNHTPPLIHEPWPKKIFFHDKQVNLSINTLSQLFKASSTCTLDKEDSEGLTAYWVNDDAFFQIDTNSCEDEYSSSFEESAEARLSIWSSNILAGSEETYYYPHDIIPGVRQFFVSPFAATALFLHGLVYPDHDLQPKMKIAWEDQRGHDFCGVVLKIKRNTKIVLLPNNNYCNLKKYLGENYSDYGLGVERYFDDKSA